VPDSPRIEELKRRVQSDPASIAFAALAEEYRRAERFEEAIETCRAGLVRHPSYLSAHVTLGRAFIEVGKLQDARQELEFVLKLAPENLAAIRGLAEIHHRMGEDLGDGHGDTPVREPQPAAVRAGQPPIISLPAETRVDERQLSTPAASLAPAVALIEPQRFPIAEPAIDNLPELIDTSMQITPHVTYPEPVDPALAGLEEFLTAIIRARAERTAAR
jgi:tetratricopeptide (TPR) repeat protein